MKAILFTLTAIIALASVASAQVPGIINYQGRVAVGGTNFNGTGQFKLSLVNAAGTTTYWSNGNTAVSLTVTKGLYSVLLGDTSISFMSGPIPASVFSNSDVRLHVTFNDGVNGVQTLTPDQRLGVVGYALVAASIDPSSDVTGQRLKIGSGHTLAGTLVTIAGGFGNTASGSYAAVGGGLGNVARGFYATVGGGESNNATNTVATVGGGFGNTASGPGAFVGGGGFDGVDTLGNTASGAAATVTGGMNNEAANDLATVAGGRDNTASGVGAFVGGGGSDGTTVAGNTASAPVATVAGGIGNVASGYASTVSGGQGNTASQLFAGVAAGFGNSAVGIDSFVGGGYGNTASGHSSLVGGGYSNISTGQESVVGGGKLNISFGFQATVCGGFTNVARGDYSFIGGGANNTASGLEGTVGGGYLNTAGILATVGGGYSNQATGAGAWVGGGGYDGGSTIGNIASAGAATVGGGIDNQATNSYATVPGGADNRAGGQFSFAAGHQARALHTGAFTWADSQVGTFDSTANDQVSFRCQGGVRFTSGAGGPNPTVSWTPGSGAWSFTSDRNAKESFAPLDVQAILAKVAQLPLTEWNYKGYTDRHVGPMAQDFHAAFPFNANDTMLNSADVAGVSLAAIQGLNQKLEQTVKEKDARIAELERRLTALETTVQKMSGWTEAKR